MSFVFKSSVVSFGSITTQPAKPAITPTVAFLNTAGATSAKSSTSDLFKLAIDLKSNLNVIAVDKSSRFESNYFSVQKSYISKLLANYDPSSLAHAFPRFKPYEDLTGLTTTRPEVIVTMTFKPLFSDEKRDDAVGRESRQIKTLTNEGELIDAQIQMFNLKYEAFIKLISSMKSNPEASKLLVDGEDQFLAHIDKLTAQANFLRSIVITLENLKQFLNIRNNRTKVDYVRLVYNYFKSYTDGLVGEIISGFEASTGFFKILGECGFTENNTKNFSNTKVYLQSLYELKKLLVCASDEMTGLDGSQKLKDVDPTSMIKTKIVNINKDLAEITDVSPSDLETAKSTTIASLATRVSFVFNQINAVQAATSDDRIAMFYHVIAKEYGYSYAHADDSFLRFAEQTFGYRPAKTGNTRMFDTFIGQPGNRIVDNVYSLNTNAAMSVGQQAKNDFIVLPFETDYIDYDSSIFSPGTVYYVDEALKVSTTGLDLSHPNEIRIIAENQTKYQSTLYKYLIPRLQSSFNNDTAYGAKVSNSRALFEAVMGTFLDPTTKELKTVFANSNLGILFDRASSDSYLKALLFLYFYVRARGIANDNSFQQSAWAAIEFINDEITKRLKASTPSSTTKVAIGLGGFGGGGISTKVAASIVTELKDKSEFTNQFSAQLGVIYDTFVASKCIVDGTTRYSGMMSSTLLMSIFEMMFSTFARLNEKKATSFSAAVAVATSPFSSRGTELFQISSKAQYHLVRKSFFEIVSNKLKFENDLVIKIILTHLNLFDTLQNAVRNSITTLQRADNVKSLNDVLKIVGSNDQLSLLMNEPQISLVKNAVDDINSKYNARARQNYKQDTTRVDVAATYLKTTQNDLVLFDDFLVPGDIKQTLYEYFSNERFSLNRGFNSRILTVGIPQGFHRFLREKVALSKITQQTLNEKENDVIRINVYKVDVRYQNIVFKPQSFLFELSRFVSKDYSSYLPVKEGASEQSIADSIPMRDYSVISDSNQQSSTTFGKSSPLYQSTEYDFLSIPQKDELMVNHIRSHMLELYTKLLSGFSLNELDFLIDESTSNIASMSQIIVNKLIDESVVKNVEPPKPAGTFLQLVSSLSTISVAPRTAVDKSTSLIYLLVEPRAAKSQENQKKVIVDVAKTKSLYSDTLQEAQRLMKPKMFDRVFNLFVDPDDFEIDHQETIKTDSGKDMLESLFSAGKVIEPLEQSVIRSSNVNMMTRLKLLDKNPKENDAVFEKYFVTLETVLGDLV